MKLTLLKITFSLLTVFIIGGIIFLYSQYAFVQEVNKQILEGASASPVVMNFDFSKKVSTSSYLLFGGAHNPDLRHKDAWDQMQDVGVTSIRTDFFIENELPKDITLEDYKNNKNDVQNPAKWERGWIQMRNSTYQMAKERGMKTIGILSYAPGWLTYTGKSNGVPKDWGVYEDIVKKIYREHRPYIDYLEVWNEPSFVIFLDPRDSGLSADQAYALIYYHASKAIREVDAEINDGKIIPLGGLVADNPDRTSTLRVLLDESYSLDKLDFISYHTYGHTEPTNQKYKQILKEKKLNIPLFITEWNYNSEVQKANDYNTSNKAISYTGWKFLDFMEMGIKGANYFNMNPSQDGFMGFYKWNGISSELWPQAKTWKLLSKKMGMGTGDFTLHGFETKSGLKSTAFTNANGEKGFLIVNPTTEAMPVRLDFQLPESHTRIAVKAFSASKNNSPDVEQEKKIVLSKKSIPTYTTFIEPESVTGIIIIPQHNWIDNLNPFYK